MSSLQEHASCNITVIHIIIFILCHCPIAWFLMFKSTTGQHYSSNVPQISVYVYMRYKYLSTISISLLVSVLLIVKFVWNHFYFQLNYLSYSVQNWRPLGRNWKSRCALLKTSASQYMKWVAILLSNTNWVENRNGRCYPSVRRLVPKYDNVWYFWYWLQVVDYVPSEKVASLWCPVNLTRAL